MVLIELHTRALTRPHRNRRDLLESRAGEAPRLYRRRRSGRAGALAEQDLLRVLVGGEVVVGSRSSSPTLTALATAGRSCMRWNHFSRLRELGEVLALVLVGPHPGIARHVGDRVVAGQIVRDP